MKKLLLILPILHFISFVDAIDNINQESGFEEYAQKAEDQLPQGENCRKKSKKNISDNEDLHKEKKHKIEYWKADGCKYCPTKGCPPEGIPLRCEDLMSPFWEKVKQEYSQEEKEVFEKQLLYEDEDYSKHKYFERIARCHIASALCAGILNDDDKKSELLVSAIVAHDYDLVKILLEYGAGPNVIKKYAPYRSNHPLCFVKSKRLAQLLVEHGVNPKEVRCSGGQNVIHRAIHSPEADLLVDYYLRQEVDPNEKDSSGDNALHELTEAIWAGRSSDMLRRTALLLIDAGASLEARNDEDETPESLFSHYQSKHFRQAG